MITNILLIVILISIIASFVILNNKLFKITNILSTITSILNNESTSVTTTVELFKKLVERFSERVLVDNEHYNNIIILLKSRFKDLDGATNIIYDKLYHLDTDITKLIIDEHEATRKEITKQAKISSKIKSKSKMNNNINKQ